MKLALAAILVLCGLTTSCTSSGSLPNAQKMDQYYESARALMKPEIDALERDRASGKVSAEEYAVKKADLDRRIEQRASDAAWTRHALAESERRMSGIPTPDAPQEISIPQAGSGAGSMPTQGTYRRFNEQDIGYSTAGPMAREFFRGYTPGGSVRGNTGGGF